MFLLPLTGGLIGKLDRSDSWFGDYRAIACGAQKVMENGRLYDMGLHCKGFDKTAVYVYLPVVAEATAEIVERVGQQGLLFLHIVLYGLSLCVLLGGVYLPTFNRLSLMQKIPFAAFLTGSAISWGNVAVVCHALILLTALSAKRFPWLFVGAVVLCGIIKPVFLTYLIVLLLLDIPVWKRVSWFSAGAIAGVAPTLWFAAQDTALSQQWEATLSYFVYELTPGDSFYGWLDLIGISADNPFAALGWALYAGLMTLSGISLAEGLKLDARSRIWLGLSLGVLLIPRLMSQDFFLIGVGLVIIALNTHTLESANRSVRFIADRGQTVLTTICVFALIGGAVDLGDYTTRIATLALSLYVLALGGLTFTQRYGDILGCLFPLKTNLLKAPQ
ncbi:hypothetical protein [Asticcacaulis tiandongensis]|uniref:hypothetical protein n=1 Tax=Asticcacaulis tiandongensis TaxID=2565365 RepID=UPI00112B9737|nr:hypothetical protein [Asticcacaulis tiandongensis]